MIKHCQFDFYDWWSFGLGLGLFKAPGTMGSVLGIVLAMIAYIMPEAVGLLWLVGLTVFSWIACQRTFIKVGGVDHKSIVSDEVVGMIWALYGVPVSGSMVLVGFLLFRFFDIVKPWPISFIDRMEHWGAHAVMLDDVAAAICTNIVLQYYYHYDALAALIF